MLHTLTFLAIIVFHIHVVRGSRTIKTVQLTENEVRNLCLKSSEIFLSQPILLELEAPLKICGESLCVVLVLLAFCDGGWVFRLSKQSKNNTDLWQLW